jgi:hypothetical protein
MAVGMLIAGEGVTRDLYVQMTEQMFGSYPMKSDDSPDGLIIHTAGESPMGFYVYDIWESKEKFMAFAEGSIIPAAQAAGGPEIHPVFYEIETIVKGSAPAA